MDLTPISVCKGDSSTGVFWDLEDYPIPDHLDPATVVKNIKLALKNNGYAGNVFVWAYLPGGKTFSKHSVQEYRDAGITTISVMEEKFERLRRITADFHMWSADNCRHCTMDPSLLVITKDMVGKTTSFLDFLEILASCYYHILFAMPDDDDNTTEQPSWVKLHYPWRFLSGGGSTDETESSQSVGDKRKMREEEQSTTAGQSI
ncbi:unnamed protein product [Microthlaspi erraticum]|uniref:NYN domain-containing protein n=1 Tax=Microthlaspi erraticum TaxID=1685480 RepID=A0A6D2HPN6_9BRAS|nr:unnamed protein product [Microthlaspi erraticum]